MRGETKTSFQALQKPASKRTSRAARPRNVLPSIVGCARFGRLPRLVVQNSLYSERRWDLAGAGELAVLRIWHCWSKRPLTI